MIDRKTISISYERLRIVDHFIISMSVVAVILAGLLIVSIFVENKGIDVAIQSYEKNISAIPELKIVKKSIKYYERILARRKLFAAQAGLKKSKTRIEFSLPDELGTQISDLQLQGIVTGARGPQAVISNIKTDQSYYCYLGERLDGFIIKEILSNKVIIEKAEETFELRL